MDNRTMEGMVHAGATLQETIEAVGLFNMLRPGLKIKKNGRIDTAGGDKTPLGLYRLIKHQLEERKP
jgi:hypothetical protein